MLIPEEPIGIKEDLKRAAFFALVVLQKSPRANNDQGLAKKSGCQLHQTSLMSLIKL